MIFRSTIKDRVWGGTGATKHLLALLVLVVTLSEAVAVAQSCPGENSVVRVGMLVVQPSQLPPRLERYRGVPFLPIAFGTGFVVSEGGQVVTTLHVIRRAEKLGSEIPVAGKKLVVCVNRPTELYECHEVGIIAVDQAHDLALLKMKNVRPTASLSAVRLSPKKPVEGTQIWAAGYPGDTRGAQLAVTTGTFLGAGYSYAARAPSTASMPGSGFWFGEMSVEGGASGAPVYLKDGSVIGVLVNRSTTHAIAGFVPAQHVIALLACKAK